MTGDPAPSRTARRLRVVVVLVAFLFLVVVVKLLDIQVLSADRYASYGASQRTREQTLAADRGAILDRNGEALALSVPQQTVYVDPHFIEDPATESALLADALGLDAERIRGLMEADNRFGYVARQISDDAADEVRALKAAPSDDGSTTVDRLPGVELITEPRRHSPSGDLARSIIGQTDIDGNGISGLEERFGDVLTGTPGRLVLEQSPDGSTIASGRHEVVDPVKGEDLQLTLDRAMQFDTERMLLDQVSATGAAGGIAIVSEPATGEILAVANAVGDEETGEVRVGANNAALTTVYEPGSVMKMITASAALEEGLVEPDTGIQVTDTLQICDAEFAEHDFHGTLTWPVSTIISQSSNVGTIKLGQMVGRDRLYGYLRAFGLGEKTALDFPNESPGELMPPEDWWCSSMGTIPIGQGVAVTPLQMLYAYNTIANGGVYQPPKLVAATVGPDGVRRPTPTDGGRRVVSRRTADRMNLMLRDVVADGTGTKAAVEGYNPAGKTGTARKPQPGGGYTGADGSIHYTATFVGFVPAESPALSIIVIIDDPSREGIYGGVVSAPLFADLAESALRRFAVPPPASDPVAARAQVEAPPTDDTAPATTPPDPYEVADGRVRAPAAGAPPPDGVPATGAQPTTTLATGTRASTGTG